MKRPSLRLFWDRLSIYLPILLMSAFAMVTIWLIRSTPAVIEAAAGKPLKHEADYFLRNFSIKAFDVQGKLKSEVIGREARHFPDTDTLEIEQVSMRTSVRTAYQQLQRPIGRFQIRPATMSSCSATFMCRASCLLERRPKSLEPVEYRSEYLHVKSDDGKVDDAPSRRHLPRRKTGSAEMP
jgi:lipopolysaccharide export system protein LptC